MSVPGQDCQAELRTHPGEVYSSSDDGGGSGLVLEAVRFWTKSEGLHADAKEHGFALQGEKGKGGDGGITVGVMCFRVRDLLIAAQVKRRSEDSSLERNHELLEWLSGDGKSEKRSDAQF